MPVSSRLRPWLPWLALLVLLALVALAYWPGLSGPFLLDDWSALPKLGAYGPVDNLVTFVSYVTSGISGPGGRPLALASFLMDAHNWPAPPWSFKFTNLLLHLLNGVLLALLIRQLSATAGLDRRRAVWVGILAASMWLAHPLFVSTTLYVVQRMAMLAALFLFAGLNLYVWGRLRLAAGRVRSGYALMIGGVVGGTLLGVLSKENAALLPLLALVLEFTALRSMGVPPSPLRAAGGGAGGGFFRRPGTLGNPPPPTPPFPTFVVKGKNKSTGIVVPGAVPVAAFARHRCLPAVAMPAFDDPASQPRLQRSGAGADRGAGVGGVPVCARHSACRDARPVHEGNGFAGLVRSVDDPAGDPDHPRAGRFRLRDSQTPAGASGGDPVLLRGATAGIHHHPARTLLRTSQLPAGGAAVLAARLVDIARPRRAHAARGRCRRYARCSWR